MANPIRRLVQLVLDKASAKRTETEAKAALGGIDKSAGLLGSTFAKLGVLIGAAFSIAALKRFGAAAVAEAKAADLAWSNLRTTLANLGEDVETRTAEIKGLAEAMQAATTFEDDDIAVALTRVMSITGDAAASINNMGLVANVAAQFFDGDLAPAADLVAKAMMGQTRQLKQLGIEAGTAQEALQILADRSMNAAENRAGTFAGKMETLSNSWGNFLEALGMAVVGSEETEGALGGLSGLIQQMTAWVESNTDTMRAWVTNGLIPFLRYANIAISVIRDLVELALYPLNLALGLSAQVLRLGAISLAGWLKLVSWGAGLAGFDQLAKNIDAITDSLDENARALDAWSTRRYEAGRAFAQSGLGHIADGSLIVDLPAAGATGGLGDDAPMTSKNAGGGDGTGSLAIPPGAEAFKLAMSEYNSEIREDAIDTAWMVKSAWEGLARDLDDPVAQALAEHTARMSVAALTAENMGTEYDALGTEAESLQSALEQLAEDGYGPLDERTKALSDRLKELQKQMKLNQKESELTAMIAQQAGDFVAAAFSMGIGEAAAQKAKMNALEAVELGVRGFVLGFLGNPVSAAAAYAGAAEHAALAVAWGALAGAAGGVGGGGGSRGGGGSSGPSRTGDVGGRRSEGMSGAGPEVSIYLVGPGWDAMNPEVQRVVMGAQQQAQERYGANARVRVQRG